ncbi:MAG: AI-2E family transporter [Chitinophagia bacterium]|nr:AI-2E family transporter [Chitinophagia bacterium]
MAIKTWQKYLLAMIPLLVIFFLFYYFGDIVSYIILAWVVSMIGAPIYSLVNRFAGPSLSAAVSLFVLTLVFMLLLRIVVPPLVTQAKNLSEIDYQTIITGLEEPIADMTQWLRDRGAINEVKEDAVDEINKTHGNIIHAEVIELDSLLNIGSDSVKRTNINLLVNIHQDAIGEEKEIIDLSDQPQILRTLKDDIFKMLDPSQIPQLIGSFLGFFGNMVITLMSVYFIAFFFLREKGLFTKMMSLLVPNKQESKMTRAVDDSTSLLVRYFIGLVIQMFVNAVLATIALKLFGFKSALLMAICFAILNVIPYVGPILGNLIGVLIVISSNLELDFYSMMLPKIVTAIIIFAVLQMIDNFILQPNIFSKSVKAHPLEIFLIVLIGAKIGGILGMVIAIPAYTVVRVLLKVFFSEFEVVKKMTASI